MRMFGPYLYIYAENMKNSLVFNLVLILCPIAVCFGQSSTSQALRTEEILGKERALRQELQKPEKFYIKEIIVRGPECLSGQKLEAIILPFKRHWLTKDNIEQLVASLRQAYAEKNCVAGSSEISYQIKKRNLIITVKQ